MSGARFGRDERSVSAGSRAIVNVPRVGVETVVTIGFAMVP
jgi:hypothetical protein